MPLVKRFERLGTSLRSRGRLSDADLEEALGEVRAALLEADVELGVVRAFLDGGARAIEWRSAEPEPLARPTGHQGGPRAVIEVLVDRPSRSPTPRSHRRSSSCGLQGAGKTTTAAKLAAWFKQQGRQPYLIAADLQRPAAVEQLRVLVPRSASTSSPNLEADRRRTSRPQRGDATRTRRGHHRHGRSTLDRRSADGRSALHK